MIGWLIRKSLPYHLLEAELQRERERVTELQAERDEYKELYLSQVKYNLLLDNKPRLSAVDQQPTPMQSDARVSRQAIEERIKQNQDEEFADYQKQVRTRTQ